MNCIPQRADPFRQRVDAVEQLIDRPGRIQRGDLQPLLRPDPGGVHFRVQEEQELVEVETRQRRNAVMDFLADGTFGVEEAHGGSIAPLAMRRQRRRRDVPRGMSAELGREGLEPIREEPNSSIRASTGPTRQAACTGLRGPFTRLR